MLVWLLVLACTTQEEESSPPPPQNHGASVMDPMKNQSKLIGTWIFNNEPGAIDFNKDGTYREYVPKGSMGNNPEAVYDEGTWVQKGNVVILTNKIMNPERKQLIGCVPMFFTWEFGCRP